MDDIIVEYEGDDAHGLAALEANEGVDLADAFEKRSPALSHSTQRRPIGDRAIGSWGALGENTFEQH